MLTVSTGNNAVAAAVKQADPTVVAAYPITPQTEIVEQIANFVAKGSLKAKYIPWKASIPLWQPALVPV